MPQSDFEPTWALITRPSGYPHGPAVGKPAMIWQANSKALYHRFSPYSNNGGGLLNFGSEPYYYIYPDENTNFPNSAKKYENRLFPLGSATIDVIRVSKFLTSGRGIGFLAKQFLLQTGQPYNETRIYNPVSPIVAAGLTLTLDSSRPMRMFDTSAGLTGIATTLLGGLGSTIFGAPKTNPVPGTTLATNDNALPDVNKSIDTKGLLRAGDALRAQSLQQQKWQGSSQQGFSLTGLVASLFQNTIPQRQDANIQYRSDEGSYGLIMGNAGKKFDYLGAGGTTFGFSQVWAGGSGDASGIRKKNEYPAAPKRFFTNPDGTVNQVDIVGGINDSIPTVGAVGYTPSNSGNANKPGVRYEDVMSKKVSGNENFQGSDVMYQYKYYADPSQTFPTKDPEKQLDEVDKQKTQLDQILKDIKASSNGIYSLTTPDGIILRNSSINYNYDRLFQTKNKGDVPSQYKFGFLKAYRNSGVRMVSNDIATSPNNSLKLPTAGFADRLNTLGVLDSSQKDTDTWQPFKDDLIALYFYDVVNDKYIPFRAAVKGIAESGNASWEEMPFIGRADKVYSYGGFNRNLSFNLHVVISSISELAPTWQRINYMMTSYKPSNYTRKASSTSGDLRYDRFMIPPMFMLTLGDLYRDQPILIQSMTATVPDDAAWETYNIKNQGSSLWSYMANTIQAPNMLFGQVPREVELGITAILLEKERAVVGGANFGHAPRSEQFMRWNYDVAGDTSVDAWSANSVVETPNLS
jgi:hypothetical protein